MADQAPSEVLAEIAESYGATIEIDEDELTGEATISLVTDDESVSVRGFSVEDATKKAIVECEEVGWERPVL
jgi:hypothetical protein